jgi:hypothetical protein
MKHLKLFEAFVNEGKPKGAPDWHDSDAPDAEGMTIQSTQKRWKRFVLKFTSSLEERICSIRKGFGFVKKPKEDFSVRHTMVRYPI